MTKPELIDILTELLGTLPQIVYRHIDILQKEGLTYRDIARAVYYIFDVQHQPIKDLDKWGIKGLVPLYVSRANNYFEDIKRQQERQVAQVRESADVATKEVKPLEQNKPTRGIDISEL